MFSIRINDIVYIKGQGMVLTGRVESGEVCTGTRAVLRTPASSVSSFLAALEHGQQIVACASAGQDVTLMVRDVDPTELIGGLELATSEESGLATWKVLDLLVENAPKRWWEFWR